MYFLFDNFHFNLKVEFFKISLNAIPLIALYNILLLCIPASKWGQKVYFLKIIQVESIQSHFFIVRLIHLSLFQSIKINFYLKLHILIHKAKKQHPTT